MTEHWRQLGNSILWTLVALLIPALRADAQVSSQVARETAEYVLRTFGKEAADQGLDSLTRQIDNIIAKYGDDAVQAVRKVGPRALRVVDDAGAEGLASVRLLARYGDSGLWVAGDPQRLKLFTQFGDDAAEAMIRHGAVAEPLLKSVGQPAAEALRTLSTQSGRRLAMLADQGDLARIGRTPELMGVVARYGDQAMDFIWKNKGALAVGGTLAAFLADPAPFLDGTRQLAQVAADQVVAPVAREIGRNTNWTLLGLVAILLAAGYVFWRSRRPRTAT